MGGEAERACVMWRACCGGVFRRLAIEWGRCEKGKDNRRKGGEQQGRGGLGWVNERRNRRAWRRNMSRAGWGCARAGWRGSHPPRHRSILVCWASEQRWLGAHMVLVEWGEGDRKKGRVGRGRCGERRRFGSRD